MDTLRVLLVEDDALNRQLAQTRLSLLGYEVTACADGFEALERIAVAQHGWPSWRVIGRDGQRAAFNTLILNAREDLLFQRQVLCMMEASVATGDESGANLARLTDQVLVAEGKKQRYGTVITRKNGEWVPEPIEDEAQVDVRRRGLGLVPLATELRRTRRMNP